MKDYRSLILNALLDKYERSKHYTDPIRATRGIFLPYDRQHLPDYWIDTTADFRLEINRVTQELAARGLITIKWSRFAPGQTVEKVALNLERVAEAYTLVGRTPPWEKEEKMRSVALSWLPKWKQEGFWGAIFLEKLLSALDRKVPLPAGWQLEEAELLEEVCRVLDALPGLVEEVPRRIFSLQVLGHSKRLEEIESRFLRVVREFWPEGQGLEDKDELLAELGIVPNPQHIYIAGPLILTGPSGSLDLSLFSPAVGLPVAMAFTHRVTELGASRIITVENLTPFYLLASGAPSNTLCLYLGGYPNRSRREFLRQLYTLARQKGQEVEFYHWGDLDLGGFRIFHHLCSRSGIPFRPYKMDRETYLQHLAYGLPFNKPYRAQLESLLSHTGFACFHEVIREMLLQGKRLEQESIAAHLE